MEWIIAIVVGGVIGYLASLVMKTDAEQGLTPFRNGWVK